MDSRTNVELVRKAFMGAPCDAGAVEANGENNVRAFGSYLRSLFPDVRVN